MKLYFARTLRMKNIILKQNELNLEKGNLLDKNILPNLL